MSSTSMRWHVFTLLLLCCVLFFQWREVQLSSTIEYEKVHSELEHLIRMDAQTELDMMMLKNRHISHYDTLTAGVEELQESLHSITNLLHGLPNMQQDLSTLHSSVALQTQAINAFKADLGIVLNSQRYLSVLSNQLSQQHPEKKYELEKLNHLVFQWLLEAENHPLKQEMIQLKKRLQTAGMAQLGKHIDVVLAYRERILQHINTAVSCGVPEIIQSLSRKFDAQYHIAMEQHQKNQHTLIALVVLLLCYLSFLLWKLMRVMKALYASNTSLNEMKNKLELEVQALSEAEQRFRQLFNVIPDAVVVHQQGRCLLANPAAVKLYGYMDEASFIGEPVMERIHDDFKTTVLQRLQHTQQGETAPVLLEKHLRLDGRELFVEVQGVSLLEHGQPMFVVLIRDVSQRMAEEEEQARLTAAVEHGQRLESLGVLAGGIAHDFNNLLSAIMGNAELLRTQTTHLPRANTYIARILQTSQRAADLCQQMLAYSGRGQFVIHPIQLSSLVKEMLQLLEVSMKKGVSIRYQLDENLPVIEGDEAQIQQVILNLVTNANESMVEGEILCSTGVMDAQQSYLDAAISDGEVKAGAYAFVEVVDSGCGMDSETLEKVFDPFFTTKFTGRGLGMSAVLGIVRGHHGALHITTALEKGTTFRLLLPIPKVQPLLEVHQAAPVDDKEEVFPALKQSSEAIHLGKVLVVDDEEIIREVASVMVEELLGMEVMLAVDGLEAVEIYQQHRQDIALVLLDMTMPRMDGKACFYALKEINPEVKVVLSSGYHAEEINGEFSGHQLAGFIQKPYTHENLESVLLHALRVT